MSAGIWFWLLYVLSIIFSGYWHRSDLRTWAGGSLVLLLLIGLLGWGVFGPPIR